MAGEHAGGADSSRVAGLDLLRGLAALSVALPHFFVYRTVFPDTFETISALAVEVFFVLSGYVLAPQILFCLGAGRPRYLGIFLMRRWMRTIPPYLVALLLISILSHQLGTADFLRYLVYSQNLFRLSNRADYFAIAWSLSVEEWFYIGFPTLLLAASWLTHRRGSRFAVVVAIGFCLTFIMARFLFGDADAWGVAVRRIVVYRLELDRLRVPALSRARPYRRPAPPLAGLGRGVRACADGRLRFYAAHARHRYERPG